MRLLRWLEYTGGALMRLAPSRYRAELGSDLVETFRLVCLDAHRERGWSGLVYAGITELGNIGTTAVKARFGGGTSISTGGPRRSTDNDEHAHRRVGSILLNDLRLAWRSVLANKMSVAIAVATLALGIGVNTAMFSVLDATLLNRMPFANADRLDEIWAQDPKQGFATPRVGLAVIREWRKQTDLFERVEAYDISSHIYQSQRGAEMVTGTVVTPGLLPMLGARPLMGRTLVDGDGRGGTDALILLSEKFWSEHFLRDPQIVGKTMPLNGITHTIVGVMPATFQFPSDASTFWLPMDVDAPPAGRKHLPQAMNMFSLRRADVSADTVETAVTARGEAIWRAAGAKRIWTGKMRSKTMGVDNDTRTSLIVLSGAVGFLLLIVCANVGNLSLSRTLARGRDFAVRASLGASRRDLIRESLVENGLIGIAGALAGLLVAAGALDIIRSVLPAMYIRSTMNPIDIDGRVLAFAAAIGLLTPLLFGLAPALLASKTTVIDALKSDTRSSTGSLASRRLRGVLVVAEVSLAIVLLTGTALMARSFYKLQAVDRGFDTRGLVTLRVGLPATGYADPYARDAFVDRMIDHVKKLPGVTSATAGAVPPESSMISFGQLEMANAPGTLTKDLILPIYSVWPGYFEMTGIPIRAGRGFADGDPLNSVIVSESFAKAHFPEGRAVGAQFRFEGSKTWRTIVGVAGEVRQLDLDDKHGSFEFYYPLKRPAGVTAPAAETGEAIVEYRTIIARAADPSATLDRLRQSVSDVDPNVVVWTIGTVDSDYADAIARPRLILVVLATFGGLGLLLAMAGIYGVLSYGVAQRRREIGIRLALGAKPESVGRLILRSGLGLTAIGLIAGVAASLGLVRVMRTLLYEVEPTDPVSVAAVALLLLVTALVASWRPARQAMKVNPVTLLRE